MFNQHVSHHLTYKTNDRMRHTLTHWHSYTNTRRYDPKNGLLQRFHFIMLFPSQQKTRYVNYKISEMPRLLPSEIMSTPFYHCNVTLMPTKTAYLIYRDMTPKPENTAGKRGTGGRQNEELVCSDEERAFMRR